MKNLLKNRLVKKIFWRIGNISRDAYRLREDLMWLRRWYYHHSGEWLWGLVYFIIEIEQTGYEDDGDENKKDLQDFLGGLFA